MKKLLLILAVLSFFACEKQEQSNDMDKSEILGTWNDGNMTFMFKQDSLRTCNMIGLYDGVYYIRENTVICKTNNGSYLYIKVEKTESPNRSLFTYWIDPNNKYSIVLQRIN